MVLASLIVLSGVAFIVGLMLLIWGGLSLWDEAGRRAALVRLALGLLCLLPAIGELCWLQYLVSHGRIDS